MNRVLSTYLIILILLNSCQLNPFGECIEADEYVTASCLYNGGYHQCELNPKEYELAESNAWEFAGFSYEEIERTDRSQDLGRHCRFYYHVNLNLAPLEPYQWFVYVDKQTLEATMVLPVVW